MLHRPIDFKIMPPRTFSLGHSVRLAVWDQTGAGGMRLTPRVGGQAVDPPVARLRVPTRWQAERCLTAFRLPADAGEQGLFELGDDEGRVLASTTMPASAWGGGFDVGALVSGLGVDGRVRIARFLLDVCRSSFRLSADPVFAAGIEALLSEIVPAPGQLRPTVKLPGGALGCVTAVPAALGRIITAAVVTGSRLHDLSVPPAVDIAAARRGQAPASLVIGTALARQGTVVLIGEGGLVCRRLAAAGQVAEPLDWLEAKPRRSERELVTRYLAQRSAAGDARAAALSREIALFAPEPGVALTDPAGPIGAEIDLAVEDGTGHVFMSGWLRDPLELIEGLDLVDEAAGTRPVEAFHRMPRPDRAAKLKLQAPHDIRALQGFVARVAVPAAGIECELRLRSGGRIRLRPRGRAWIASAARDAVLSSVPADVVSPSMLAQAIAPAAVALQAQHLAGRRAPDVLSFGPAVASPEVSLIIPLYRNLSFLPFQVASFAIDPAMAGTEIVYILDSPEQRAEVEIQLRHLSAVYGLSMRLVVMSGNFGYAAANNAGVAAAKGRFVVLMNSDVVPEGPGWLAPLVARLVQPDVGAVGARLLFDDGSLQHAGLYFAADDRGEWRNRHYFKGFPRDFLAAAAPRSVPAVTGACVALRRDVFEGQGGFNEGYVIGDYEDSDLCLRLRARGLAVIYEPESTLMHFERQSVPLHASHAQGLASECNRWLHASLWQSAMETVMAEQERVVGTLNPLSSTPRRPRRRSAR